MTFTFLIFVCIFLIKFENSILTCFSMLLDRLLQHNTFQCFDLSEFNIFTTFGHLSCYTITKCCCAIINYVAITILVVKSLPLICYYPRINSWKWNIRLKGCMEFKAFDTLYKNALQKKIKVLIYTPPAVLQTLSTNRWQQMLPCFKIWATWWMKHSTLPL